MAVTGEAEAFRQEALDRLRAGDVDGGARSLASGWRAFPAQDLFPTALIAVLRAHPERFLPHSPRSAEPVGSVSVVICSADDDRFASARRSIEGALEPQGGEFIRIADARSLAEGYQRGLQQAHGEIVVFSHDDVRMLSVDLGAALRHALDRVDLVGVVGTTRLTGPAWGWSGRAHGRGRIVQPHPAGAGVGLHLLSFSESVTPGLQALDGAFFATRRETALRLRFDSEAFDGFHLYDLDFSFRAARSGLRVGVSHDILLCHDSLGDYGPEWRSYAERFRAKFEMGWVEQSGTPLPPPVMFTDAEEAASACLRLDAVCRSLG